MNTHGIQSEETSLGASAVLVHLGLVLFGIAALLSGGLAGDYKKVEHAGYTLHGWLGMGGAFFIFLRIVLGVAGPRHLRFSQWAPCTRERLRCVVEDIAGLLRFRLPDRPSHTGVAALVQAFGLLAFFAAAASGLLVFSILEPGVKASGLAHAVKEFHEGVVFLVAIFLFMHVGATIAHALHGRHFWRPMIFMKERRDIPAPE